MNRSNVIVAATLALLLLAAGCANTKTQYYFAAANLDAEPDVDPKLTFYRVSFEGKSFLTKASFQTGFYDAEALHQLFGEVKKPEVAAESKRGATPVTSGDYTLVVDPATGAVRAVDDGQRFTILYGANADAMASQVQAFADSQEVGDQLGRLLAAGVAQPALTAAEAARQRSDAAAATATTLADQLTAAVAALPDPGPAAPSPLAQPPAVRRALLAAAQAAVTAAGSDKTLDADPDKGLAQARELLALLSK